MIGAKVTRTAIEAAAHKSHPGFVWPLTVGAWRLACAYEEHIIRLRDSNAYRGKRKHGKAFSRAVRACGAYMKEVMEVEAE